MLTIIRGNFPSLDELLESEHINPSRPVIVLKYEPTFIEPWAGVRSLLAVLQEALGNETVQAAFRPRRALLSLVLRGLGDHLTDSERTEREHESGLFLGELPNTNLNPRPLIEAWAETLAALLQQYPCVIVIPDVTSIDLETIDVLRPLIRRLDDSCGVKFVLSSGDRDPLADKIDGRSLEIIKRNELPLLQALPATVVRTMQNEGCRASIEQTESVRSPFDFGEESVAWQALGESTDGCTELAMAGLRAAFAGFGFAAALRIAEQLLRRHPHHPEVAEIHRLAALSTHSMSPMTERDAELDAMVEHHLQAALATETSPRLRSVLLYRLSILRSNAHRDGAGAFEYSTRSLQEASTLDPRHGADHAAWAHNSRGLACFRMRRPDEALAECQKAVSLLDEHEADLDIPEPEIAVTKCYVLENLIRMSYLVGDHELSGRYLDQHEACLPHLSPAKRAGYMRSVQLWEAIKRSQVHLQSAAEKFAASLAQARQECDTSLVAVFAAYLGDCLYRLGDAHSAYEHLVVAQQARMALAGELLHEDAGWFIEGELNCAVTARAAGLHGAVERHIGRILRHLPTELELLQGALWPLLAVSALHRGDIDACEDFIRRATLAAAETTDAAARYRTLCSLGDALLRLNRPDEARDCFTQCVSIVNEAGSLPPATDFLPVLVGLLESGISDVELLDHALRIAPEALGNSNVWQQLPRLLSHLAAFVDAGAFPLPDEGTQPFTALHSLLDAASQRGDCAEYALGLTSRLLPNRKRDAA